MEKATLGQATKLMDYFRGMSREALQNLFSFGLLGDLCSSHADVTKVNRNAFRQILGLEPFSRFRDEQELIVPAVFEPFVAQVRFMLNSEDATRPLIGFLSEDFKKWFLGKTEESKPTKKLSSAWLQMTDSVDGPILLELGDRAEVGLAQLYALLTSQYDGDAGALAVPDYANVFYVLDVNGVLRRIRLTWSDHEGFWSVSAYSTEEQTYTEDSHSKFFFLSS